MTTVPTLSSKTRKLAKQDLDENVCGAIKMTALNRSIMAARLEVDDFDKIVFLDSNDVVDVTRYVRSFNASNDKCSFSVSVCDFFKNGEFSTSQGAISVETKFFGESVNYNTRKRKMWVDCRSMSDDAFGEYIDLINARYDENDSKNRGELVK